MADSVEKIVKAERIELRVTPQTKALLAAAAQARHTTISEFLLSLGVEAAEKVIATPRIFYASEEAWEKVQALLNEEPTAPDPATLAWLRRQAAKTSV